MTTYTIELKGRVRIIVEEGLPNSEDCIWYEQGRSSCRLTETDSRGTCTPLVLWQAHALMESLDVLKRDLAPEEAVGT
jgi:hypothetical protein